MEIYVEAYANTFQVHKRNVSHRAQQYIKGLLQASHSNMEKMAEVVPDTDEQALQQFLSDSPWDYRAVMDKVACDTNALLGGKDSALLLDESAVPKKGTHSVGVSRQWCGRLGKVDNCQVGVFASLAQGSDSCLVDAELFLPNSWIEDKERCAKARVPQERCTERSKLTIALDLVKRARAKKLDYGWVGADSFYGRDRGFQQTLEAMGEVFMVDVPADFHVYLHDPRPYLPPAPARGRAPTRLHGRRKSVEARQWAKRQPRKAWRCYTYRNGTKGPMTVEALHRRVWVWDGQSEQAYCRHIVIRRDADGETKFSISNAKARTSVHRLLFMQGQRHFIERGFQDSKSQLGLDQYQARNWNSWHHHMALIMMAMCFLLRQRAIRKDSYPLLTVSDMVYVFACVLPSRVNNLQQAIAVIEERHQKRQHDIDRRAQLAPILRSGPNERTGKVTK